MRCFLALDIEILLSTLKLIFLATTSMKTTMLINARALKVLIYFINFLNLLSVIIANN